MKFEGGQRLNWLLRKKLLSKSPALLGFKKIIEYSLRKVIPKDLVSVFILTKTWNVSKFSKLQYMFFRGNTLYPYFNISNPDFLDQSATIVGILLISTLMLFFLFCFFFMFRNCFWSRKKNNINGSCSCDPAFWFDFLFQNHSIFYSEKRRCPLKISPQISKI